MLKERLALLIDADTRGAVRGLNQVGNAARTDLGAAQSSISKFTDSLRTSAPIIGAALGSAAYGIYQTTESASRLSSATGALDATFKGSASGMREFAESADRLGLSQAGASEVAARLGSGLQGLGFTAGESAGEVERLVERAADMSVGFGTTEQALSAISALLRGERDPIEQYGVAIKQVDVDARLAAEGLKGLTGDALKNAQATASLELLYESTADRIGLYGSESNAVAREQAELTAKMENLTAELGTALLPAVTDLVGGMNTAIDVGRELADVLGAMASSAADAVPDIGSLLDSLPGWAKGATSALGEVDDLLGGIFSPDRSDLKLLPEDEFDRVQQGTARAVFSWLGLGDAVSSVNGLIGETARASGGADDGLADVADKYESIFGELFAYQDALRGVEDGSRKVADAHKTHADAQRDAADAAEDVRQAAVDVAEAMVLQFDATDAARKGIDDYAAAQAAATDPVFAMIRALERQDELLKKAAKGGRVKKDGTKMTASGSAPTLLDFAEGAAGVQQAAIGLAGALRTGDTSIEAVRESLARWVQQGLLTQDQADQMGSALEEAAGKANALEGANVDSAAAAGIAAGKFEAQKEAAERTKDAQARLRDTQERLISAQERVASTGEDIGRAHDDATRKAWALEKAQFELNDKVAKNPGLVDEAKRQMQDWVDRGLVPAAQAAKDLKEMLAGVNQELFWNGVAMATLGSDKQNMPQIDPITGRFSGATGGRVPGPMGQPVSITAHGGEQLVSNMDLNRMRQTPGVRSSPLMVVENMVVPDVATGVREGMGELEAAQYRAGLN